VNYINKDDKSSIIAITVIAIFIDGMAVVAVPSLIENKTTYLLPKKDTAFYNYQGQANQSL
jgi:hypothetical protein